MVGFVRQLSHDLRNHLNAVELQSAFLNELAETPELKEEMRRLREMLTEMNGSLQRLTSSVASIKLTPMPYEADAFVEDLTKGRRVTGSETKRRDRLARERREPHPED